ncbi:MAG: ATP-binding protein [Gemmatimonadota bacterium]|nr:ATP-binding protein [Gemmatimonadota bacterium]
MNNNSEIYSTISTLISRRAEGTYWDFKREHHKNKADLIHDVLCLANADHDGNRYLIYGVDDRNYSIHPMNEDPGRRTQADIAGLFRDNAEKFFQSRIPEFYLKEIELGDELLDVLVIEDAPHKPYYLIQRLGKIHAHHIYSRVCDTNTPVNDAAQAHEIERMWRQRFGLDAPPLKRMGLYLREPDAWSPLPDSGGNMGFYYTTFPEFTIRSTDAEDQIACREEWTRGELVSKNNYAGYYELRFHQTLLRRIRYVGFDDRKKSMVAPDWEPRGPGRFYFYEGNSIIYAVQRFHASSSGDDSVNLSVRLRRGEVSDAARARWGSVMKIPVLNPGELEAFLDADGEDGIIHPSTDDGEQYELFLRNQLDFEDWRSGGNAT